jgi:hypothetical protein
VAVPADPHEIVAKYKGRTIDLSRSWGTAQACLVWQQGGISECFATHQELQARESALRASSSPTLGTATPNRATSTCASSLDLFSGTGFSGSELSLWDRGVWVNLSSAGFSNVTVSFSGGACSFHLANGTFGSGSWYPGNTNAFATAYDMGTWNRTIKSTYIN